MPQTLKNHSRYLIIWHFITSAIMGIILVQSIINLVNAQDKFPALLQVGLIVVIILIWFYSRSFALRAQDRAIRAEENFRHYILTGKPFDPNLHMRQIIALRFASDAEMPALAKRAVDEKLSPKEIKRAVTNWRPDYNRV